MGLEKLLAEHRAAIEKKWMEKTVDMYPPDTSAFLKKQNDIFANPVGAATRDSLHGILDLMLQRKTDAEAAAELLDPIVRIRAVQPMFTPSQAVGFLPMLKAIIRRHFKSSLKDVRFLQDLLAFEMKIDEITLTAFDVFVKCREKVISLQATHRQDKMFRAFHRAGLIDEIPEASPDV